MRPSMIAAAAGAAFVASLPWTPAALAEEWTCYTYIPNSQHDVMLGLERLGERITEITDGEVTVTCHVGGSLGIQAADIGPAVADGIVDIASNAFITGYVPVTGVFSLPGLISTEEELQTALEVMQPILEEAMAEKGLVYIGNYNYPRQVVFSTEEVTSLDDLDGKKIRVASVEQAEFATRFGGTPVTIGTPDVAPALQRGTVNVVLTAAAGGARLWADILEYNYVVGPNYTVSPMFMNQERYESLTSEQQQAVRDAAAEIGDEISSSMREENAELTEQFEADGMVVTEGSEEAEEELVSRLQSYWPEWVEQRGPRAEEALETVREALGR